MTDPDINKDHPDLVAEAGHVIDGAYDDPEVVSAMDGVVQLVEQLRHFVSASAIMSALHAQGAMSATGLVGALRTQGVAGMSGDAEYVGRLQMAKRSAELSVKMLSQALDMIEQGAKQ